VALGGDLPTLPAHSSDPSDEISNPSDEILAWIRSHQDADGRVNHSTLATHFLTSWAKKDLDSAIDHLMRNGTICMEDEWLRIL
jgi:hypothetical protein